MYSNDVIRLSTIIIYEDNDVVVINKPAGLSVHGDGKSEGVTLVDSILDQFPEMKSVGEPMEIEYKGEIKKIYRPGIVHRLDKDTSGVMILAKHQDAFMFLKTQFQQRETSKVYHAFVYGNIKDDSGVIDAQIGRSPSDIRMWSAGRGKRGTLRDALTKWNVLKRGVDGMTQDRVTYVELFPKTGRTHQLRVHMKFNNTPIVADPLYAPKRPHLLGFDRLALHACALTVMLPSGKSQTFEAPFPEDFISGLEQLKPLQS